MRFLCSTYGGGIAGVRVSEDSFVVVTAEVSGNELVEVTIAVGLDGTCACMVNTAHGQAASAAPDARSLERVLATRLAEAGVRGHRRRVVTGGERTLSRRPSIPRRAGKPGGSKAANLASD